ncbi:hypothetical protein AKJ41_03235 [candidate division MSBL1 archaeon SCGC-AAA259O05]|uniref:Uncharacterized protein n=1 Tax=candidate division MSBL1 archaeon SCGC-AAA259O05 TaxID=1698271 RepID=A0A133V3H5_9EURY|nr:hypothetical protein AKJ41_03235 [candidate division MSBL1 archaeon SCGC-AAA259O05]
MSLSKKEILESYRRAEPIVKKWAENGDYVRLGSNGPGEGWYEYPEGYSENVRRPRMLDGDYRKLSKKAAKGARSIYGTITIINPKDGFVQQKKPNQVWKKENEDDNPVQGNPLPEYEDIESVTLFADVDLEGDYKPRREEEDVKKTVEKAIPIYVKELRKLAPNSVNVLDSGGGFYPHIHHSVTKPIAEEFEGEARGWIFDELMSRFNTRLDEIEEIVKDEVVGASEILDPDALNNKNRLMKAPLSIHRKLDIVVHPIDPDNPDFDPEPAPVTEEVVEETEKWLDTRDSNSKDTETLISELWPDYEGSWEERLRQWYEDEKEKREKREKERLEHKRKMEERRGELREKGVSIKGFPVTNCFEDILAGLETIDVRDMVSPYITDERDGQQPRFNPPWRSSETGTSCFASRENFVDINEGNTGGGPVKFAAREHELISSCDEDLEGEKWWQALELLRQEYGYKIPILIPDGNTKMPGEDSETYDQTPHWAIIKAGFAFGIIDESHIAEREIEGEEEKEEYFPIGAYPSEYNQILRKLENSK